MKNAKNQSSRQVAASALGLILSLSALPFAAAPAWASAAENAVVERNEAGALVVRWTSTVPVDVFRADSSSASIKAARLVSARDADGVETVADAGPARGYVILRNTRTGETLPVAERVIPLAGGSNFRDIGGYPAAGGKHVRWGMVYRSGATTMLTASDLAQVGTLGLADMIDLRSDEERVLAPSRIDGVRYATVGYSMTAMKISGGMDTTYRQLPSFLAPQLRLIFATLLRGEGPLAYNCSAGQDRTGFATAMILSALGTPRDVILSDYHLSTTYRRPENEMPPISDAQAASNPVAAMFASYQRMPNTKPQPLKTADGTAYLSFALAEIEAKWGSVDNYLKSEIGLSAADLHRLRALYTS